MAYGTSISYGKQPPLGGSALLLTTYSVGRPYSWCEVHVWLSRLMNLTAVDSSCHVRLLYLCCTCCNGLSQDSSMEQTHNVLELQMCLGSLSEVSALHV